MLKAKVAAKGITIILKNFYFIALTNRLFISYSIMQSLPSSEKLNVV